MCWVAAPFWLQMAGAGLSAVSAIQSGRAQQASAEFNAEQMRTNAANAEEDIRVTQEQAGIDRRRLGAQLRADKGSLQAQYAAMGVDPGFGSPADLVGDLGQAYAIDRSILNQNESTAIRRIDQERADLLNSARLTVAEGKSAARAGTMNAFGSLLSSASGVAGKWAVPSAATSGATKSLPTTKKVTVPKYTPAPYKSGLRVYGGG